MNINNRCLTYGKELLRTQNVLNVKIHSMHIMKRWVTKIVKLEIEIHPCSLGRQAGRQACVCMCTHCACLMSHTMRWKANAKSNNKWASRINLLIIGESDSDTTRPHITTNNHYLYFVNSLFRSRAMVVRWSLVTPWMATALDFVVRTLNSTDHSLKFTFIVRVPVPSSFIQIVSVGAERAQWHFVTSITTHIQCRRQTLVGVHLLWTETE